MSLDVDKLQRSLNALFSSPSTLPSTEQAERSWAEAYHRYALDAEDASTDSVMGLDSRLFKLSLLFKKSRSPQEFSNQLARALMAYWDGVQFETGVVPPVAPVCPSVGGNGEFGAEVSSEVVSVDKVEVVRALLPAFSAPSQSSGAQAMKVARAFHRATTRAVTVLITGTDTSTPTPLNIINICGVF